MERVLIYIEQPQQVLDEMVRMLRPGGAVILFEFDYNGMVVDAPDQALTRRIGRRGSCENVVCVRSRSCRIWC